MLEERSGGPERTLQLDGAFQTRRAVWQTPSILTCTAMILLLKLALRIFGFRSVLRWIGRRVKLVPATAWPELEAVRAAERAVATAGALYPGRALCLEQSLVLYYVLRRRGVPVVYRHGVQPQPFEAHAWIEYCGEAINDVPEHSKRYASLPDLLP
jgi:hypothetical protein